MTKTKVRRAFNLLLKSYTDLRASEEALKQARDNRDTDQHKHAQWQEEMSEAMGDDCMINIQHKGDIYQVTKIGSDDKNIRLDKIEIHVKE